MYKRVQGPHSPLSPLPPLPRFKSDSPMLNYLTPSHGLNMKMNSDILKRRSFTPLAHNGPSPTLSPINNFQCSPLHSTFVVDRAGSPKTPKVNHSMFVPTITHSAASNHSDSSGVSIYFTPPSSITVNEKVWSSHRFAPRYILFELIAKPSHSSILKIRTRINHLIQYLNCFAFSFLFQKTRAIAVPASA